MFLMIPIGWSYKKYPESERATEYSNTKGKIGAYLKFFGLIICAILDSAIYLDYGISSVLIITVIIQLFYWVWLLFMRPKVVDKQTQKIVEEDLIIALKEKEKRQKIDGLSAVINSKFELLLSQRSAEHNIKNNVWTNPHWYEEISTFLMNIYIDDKSVFNILKDYLDVLADETEMIPHIDRIIEVYSEWKKESNIKKEVIFETKQIQKKANKRKTK